MSGTWRMGDVSYAVDGISDADAASLPPTTQCLRAERAVALAALEGGNVHPATLRFARLALGRDQTGLAIALSMRQLEVAAMESGNRAISKVSLWEFCALLRQSDRGGFVARRVTP